MRGLKTSPNGDVFPAQKFLFCTVKMRNKIRSASGPSLSAYEPSCSVDVLAQFILTIYGRDALQVAEQHTAAGTGRGPVVVAHWRAVLGRLRDFTGE